jgi:hypothetical protein
LDFLFPQKTDFLLNISPTDRNHKMDFAGCAQAVTEFRIADMPIHHDRDGWAQAFPITQPFLEAGVEAFQVFDHLSNRFPVYGQAAFPVCKFAQ